MPDVLELYTKCKIKQSRYQVMIPPEYKIIFDFHRVIQHINQVEIRHVPVIENFLEMRIRYLTGIYTEDEYKLLLQRSEKAREKRRDILNILTMFTQTGSDLLRQFVNNITRLHEQDVINNLRDYTNETLCTISKRYTCVVPQIHVDSWEIVKLKF
jgi:hypothetical protein